MDVQNRTAARASRTGTVGGSRTSAGSMASPPVTVWGNSASSAPTANPTAAG